MKKDIFIETLQESGTKIPEKQIEMFARRLLPEIKKFLANDKIRTEFEEWQNKKNIQK